MDDYIYRNFYISLENSGSTENCFKQSNVELRVAEENKTIEGWGIILDEYLKKLTMFEI